MIPDRRWLAVSSFLVAIGIATGAFGAHALRESLTADRIRVFETGVQYHHLGALSLVIASLVPFSTTVRWLFLAGTLLFSATLYLYSITGIRGFALVTPIGGFSLIMGWVLAGLGALKRG